MDRSPPTKVCIFLALLSVMGVALGAEMPQSPEVDRYSLIWERAPFVAVTEVTPTGESMAKRFAITGFARTGGDDVLFMFDRKGLKRFVVSKAFPRDGIEILSVEEGASIRDLKAKVRAEGEVVEISFDPSLQDSGEKQPDQPGTQAAATPTSSAPKATPEASSAQNTPREAPKPGHTVRRNIPVGAN